MSTTRLTYSDADAFAQLVGDARAVEARMAFPGPRPAQGHDASGPQTVLSPGTPAISDDLADRAAGMELHLT